jgi:5-methylcytosine-specific restriction endonuclease McrA
MAEANPCMFCDHPLDGRSKKFCTTCLPPLGQWADPKGYAREYHILRCAVGIGTNGVERCRIPKSHGAYIKPTKPGAIHGPWLTDRPIYGPRLTDVPELGPPKPPARILRVVDEAFAKFPRQHPAKVSFVDGRSVTNVAAEPDPAQLKPNLTSCEWCGDLCRLRRHKHGRDLSLCPRCRFIKMGTSKSLNAARRQEAARLGDRITWLELGKRDRWVCHLCNRKVPHKAGNMDPAGATVDHLIPISAGGSHTWDNVALAHRSCNMARNARGTVQLRLIA